MLSKEEEQLAPTVSDLLHQSEICRFTDFQKPPYLYMTLKIPACIPGF